MANPFRSLIRIPQGGTWLSLALAAAVAGCGGGANGHADGSTGDGSGGCPVSNSLGTLSVHIVGTSDGSGSVSVADLSSATTPASKVGTTSDLSLAAGPYGVTADRVAPAASLIRTAYEPSIDVDSACVRAGATTTVTVTYTAIATSNKLWAGNSKVNEAMVGFAAGSLGASGTPAATVAGDTAGSGGFTFDSAGNLWVLGATTQDPPIAVYLASDLGTSGAKNPAITIDSPSFGNGIPGPSVLAFDASGNLWVSVVSANKVVKFTPAQLTATGTPTAAVETAGINAPSGIAFSATGDMFVSSGGDDTVVRVDAAHLVVSGTGFDLAITANSPPPVIGALPPPQGLAFDGAGDLWVNFGGTIARIEPADLAGTGTKSITPTIQIETDVASLPTGIAFDEGGGLWLAYSAGKFGRLGPNQLTASASATPGVIITSPDVAYADWFAIYPAPASTPLAHRLP